MLPTARNDCTRVRNEGTRVPLAVVLTVSSLLVAATFVALVLLVVGMVRFGPISA